MEYKSKGKEVHDDKYDYSKVEYINKTDKVIIICPEHGEFKQRLTNHINGNGCPNCRGMAISKSKTKTTDNFINKSKLIHGDKYNYSNVEYTNHKTKVKIICPEHGEFEQTPSKHMQKCGCPECGFISRCNLSRSNTNQFINKGNEVHGDKYDYSFVEYIGNLSKVKIICPEHGEFEQTPKNHKKGHGCSKCNESKGEREIRKYLTENKINFIPQHRFNDCRNILPLPFDFYLPNYNVCIEYQGIQHYKSVKKFGGEQGLKKRQFNDELKITYCNDNNIKLITLKYNEEIIINL